MNHWRHLFLFRTRLDAAIKMSNGHPVEFGKEFRFDE